MSFSEGRESGPRRRTYRDVISELRILVRCSACAPSISFVLGARSGSASAISTAGKPSRSAPGGLHPSKGVPPDPLASRPRRGPISSPCTLRQQAVQVSVHGWPSLRQTDLSFCRGEERGPRAPSAIALLVIAREAEWEN
jgi:hypothetical protein